MVKWNFQTRDLVPQFVLNGTMKEFEGSNLLETKVLINTTNHTHSYNTKPEVTTTIKLTTTLTSNPNGATLRLRFLTDSSVLISEKIITVTGTGTWTISLTYLGRKPSSPTYLEELHKLDNFTKAQYLPFQRRLPKGLF